jgi:hypothetical protein
MEWRNEKMTLRNLMLVFSLAVLLTAISSPGLGPQTAVLAQPAAEPTPADKPLFSSYRGVEIGMLVDDARKKLGSAKDKSNEQDYFEFSDNESANVYYDEMHKVRAISITFSGKLDAAPTPMSIFGEDAEAKPDGGIHKMQRYPKAGFWISYSRTAGDDPMVIIAMQKI